MFLRRVRTHSVLARSPSPAARASPFWTTAILAIASATSSFAKETATALPGVELAATFEDALEDAKRTQRSILVILHTDEERGCAEMAKSVYGSSEFRKAAARSVVLVASPDEHSVDDECDRFAGFACRDHAANFETLFTRYFVGHQEAVIPQHLVLAPDGRLIARLEYVRTKQDLLSAMAEGEAFATDPTKAIVAHESEVIADLQTMNAKSGAVAEKAAKRLLADLETVYAAATIDSIAKKATPKAKRLLMRFMDRVAQHADPLFVALLDDADPKIRAEAATAIREFPVVCSAARAKLREIAANDG